MVGAIVKICPTCEAENAPDVLVCTQCGSTFTSGKTRQVPTSAIPKSDDSIDQLTRQYSDSFVFLILGNEHPLIVPRTPEPITLGRFVPGDEKPTVDLMNYGAGMHGVSRMHAMIQTTAQGYTLKDLNSTNGTWLNETVLLPRTPYPIHNGDKIRLGQIVLHIYFAEVEPAEQSFFLVNREQAHQHPVTSEILVAHVAPYLRTVEALQQQINTICHEPHFEMEINAISATKQSGAISVRVSNAGQAIRLLKDVVTPWKRSHAEAIQTEADDLPDLQKQLVLDLVHEIQADIPPDELVEQLLPLIQTLTRNPLEISTEQTVLETI